MSEGPRPAHDALLDAVDRVTDAGREAHSARSVGKPPRPSGARTRAVTGFALLALASFFSVRSLRDPFPVAPETVTAHTMQAIDMVRLGVEEYREQTGRLPSSLEEIGLDGLGLTYIVTAGVYDVTGVDGWGDLIGYHGEPGVTP